MARDSQIKLSKKETYRSKKHEELSKNKIKNHHSDSDDNSESGSDSEDMDVHEYRKYISKIFPSKHLNKKIKAGEKLKKVVDSDDSEEEIITKKKSKKSKKIETSDEDTPEEEEKIIKKSSKSKKTHKVESSDDEDQWEDETEEEEEKISNKPKKSTKSKSKKIDDTDDDEQLEDQDTDEDDESEIEKSGKGKINITFTIGGMGENEDEYDDEFDSDYEDYEDDDDDTEDEDEEVSSEEDDVSEEEEEENQPKKKKNKKEIENNTTENNTTENNTTEMLEQLKKMQEANPNDKSIKKCIKVYQENIKSEKLKNEKKEKKQKEKNLRIFKKILRDKNTMNDLSFYEKIEPINQKKIIKELREINKITRIEKPYRMTLLESDIPIEFKASAMKKINSLRYMEQGSGEFYKSKNWVDTFMRIPFNKHEGLPISIDDGVEKCHEFMENAQQTLDQAVYGLNDAKMQIMQMLGQLLTNPKAIGAAIAIHGPPGTGKTSLVKEGISKILNRPFAFIALGGATDSSFLEGHGYTYEGSTWGKIVQILIDSKCMNPVIYFDELDKISDTPRGEEIAGILTHLTDTSQNSQFHDKYFAEIDFDLSKCLFIFSYNDETKINPILKDRMYRIKTKGYNSKEKTIIANKYLLPKIREQVRFNEEEIIIPIEVLTHIIDTHCNKEDGVRNLKRCLEIIYTKLNLYRLMKPGSNLFEGEMSLQVEFPFTVSKVTVDKLIKRESDGLETWRALYN